MGVGVTGCVFAGADVLTVNTGCVFVGGNTVLLAGDDAIFYSTFAGKTWRFEAISGVSLARLIETTFTTESTLEAISSGFKRSNFSAWEGIMDKLAAAEESVIEVFVLFKGKRGISVYDSGRDELFCGSLNPNTWLFLFKYNGIRILLAY